MKRSGRTCAYSGRSPRASERFGGSLGSLSLVATKTDADRGAVSRARTADMGAGPKSNTTLPGPVEPVQYPVGGGGPVLLKSSAPT
jgi:hypothetical protein